MTGLCWAQPHEQTGFVRQELQLGGMQAFHPSLPIGSRAVVRNVYTGSEIEVIIMRPPGVTPLPPGWVIGLAPDAASALSVSGGETVFVTNQGPLPIPPGMNSVAMEPPLVAEPPMLFPPPLPLPPPVGPEPVPVVAYQPLPVPPEVEKPPPQPPQPLNITIHNYIVIPDNLPEERRERPLRQNMRSRRAIPIAEEQAPEEIPAAAVLPDPPPMPPPLPVQPPPQPVPAPPLAAYLPPPVHMDNVVIIPGFPDPHSARVYRIQVGAYSGIGSASLAVRQVEAAGFTAVQETHGNLFRVFVEGIPSWNVQASVQRLAALGFLHMWIRE